MSSSFNNSPHAAITETTTFAASNQRFLIRTVHAGRLMKVYQLPSGCDHTQLDFTKTNPNRLQPNFSIELPKWRQRFRMYRGYAPSSQAYRDRASSDATDPVPSEPPTSPSRPLLQRLRSTASYKGSSSKEPASPRAAAEPIARGLVGPEAAQDDDMEGEGSQPLSNMIMFGKVEEFSTISRLHFMKRSTPVSSTGESASTLPVTDTSRLVSSPGGMLSEAHTPHPDTKAPSPSGFSVNTIGEAPPTYDAVASPPKYGKANGDPDTDDELEAEKKVGWRSDSPDLDPDRKDPALFADTPAPQEELEEEEEEEEETEDRAEATRYVAYRMQSLKAAGLNVLIADGTGDKGKGQVEASDSQGKKTMRLKQRDLRAHMLMHRDMSRWFGTTTRILWLFDQGPFCWSQSFSGHLKLTGPSGSAKLIAEFDRHNWKVKSSGILTIRMADTLAEDLIMAIIATSAIMHTVETRRRERG